MIYIRSILLVLIMIQKSLLAEDLINKNIESSVVDWYHSLKIIQFEIYSLATFKKTIDLEKLVSECYSEITNESSKDSVLKCFSYDYLSHFIFSMDGRKIEGIKRNQTGGFSMQKRLYDGLLKIGVSREVINSQIGAYELIAMYPASKFRENRKRKKTNRNHNGGYLEKNKYQISNPVN